MEEMSQDVERPSVTDCLRSMRVKGETSNCCSRHLEAAWSQHWGQPLHTVFPADLICLHGERTSSISSWQMQRSHMELKIFFPPPQELGIDPSRPGREWLPAVIDAAKERRRACFNRYGCPQPAPAALLMPPVTTDDAALPHDLLLLAMVLPHLPLPSVFRARAVCQSWCQTLSSPVHLRRLTTNADFVNSRLIMQTSIPGEQSCLAIFDQGHWLPNPIPLPPFCLRAAGGGLLCFSFETARGYWEEDMLLVGNPVTQQWRKLPSVPGLHRVSRDVACTMLADPLQGCYKIFLLDNSRLSIYDSLSDNWLSIHRRWPKAISGRVRFCRRECSVTSSGLLHQLSLDGKVVFSYDTEEGSTSYVETYGPSNMDTFQLQEPCSRLPALAYCNGRVFVVARIKVKTPIICIGKLPCVFHGPVAIWELNETGFGDMGKWGWPVFVVPQEMLEDAIEGSDGTDFCVTTDGDKSIYLVLSGGAMMLVYDVISGVWSSLPGCPSSFLIGFHSQPYYTPLLWLGPV
ncbi:hypothetical protein L7F22_061186 [Adiantum nelumboides]|nr:hypothetical protein [Adiantum nelumboides]